MLPCGPAMNSTGVLKRFLRLACTALLLVVLSPDTHGATAKKVVLATGEWPPYSSEHMEGHGIFTTIVTAVFAEMGVTPVYRFYPWKRAEHEVRKGHAFAAFPYIITPERFAEFTFSESIAFNSGRLFYDTRRYPEGIVFHDMNDLSHYRIGGSLGYWYEEVFKKHGIPIDYAQTDEQNIHKLLMGRIDLVPLDEAVGLYLIRKLHPDKVNRFAFAEKPLNQDSLHLMISRTYPGSSTLTRQFAAALERIKTNGVYERTCNRYGIIMFRSQTLLYLGGTDIFPGSR